MGYGKAEDGARLAYRHVNDRRFSKPLEIKAGITLSSVLSRQGRGCLMKGEKCYFLMKRYRSSRRMAPPVASRMLPILNPVTVPSPRKDPT